MPNLNWFDILSILIFCKIALSISISISIFSKITISISISISIFFELPYRYRYRYRYFQIWPYRYRYRYRYFSKVSIYRQSICHIDISNRARANRGRRRIDSMTGCQRINPSPFISSFHLGNQRSALWEENWLTKVFTEVCKKVSWPQPKGWWRPPSSQAHQDLVMNLSRPLKRFHPNLQQQVDQGPNKQPWWGRRLSSHIGDCPCYPIPPATQK